MRKTKITTFLAGAVLLFAPPLFLISTTSVSASVSFGKMGYILLYRNPSELTEGKIAKLTIIKERFSSAFYNATNGSATIDTTDQVYSVQVGEEMLFTDSAGKVIDLNLVSILRKFYESHSDKFDYIGIYTAFPLERPGGHSIVIQSVRGIGLEIFDNSRSFGSNKVLKGIDLIGYIDIFSVSDLETQISLIVGLELHEFGHQWCCFIGDAFRRGANSARLEIRDDNAHFYPGLQSPWREPMGANEWISNGDGTFRAKQYDNPSLLKYHPFHLYFMGLLPDIEYSKQYEIYDAGLNPVFPTDFERVVFYKSVSVNDIITVEGKREVVDTDPPSAPTNLIALVALAAPSSQINLSWFPSTDNVGVAGYKVYRNKVQIATRANTFYSDSGLSPSTTYTYIISAYDAAGNVSAQSLPAVATTLPAPDTTPPTVSITYPANNQTISGTITVSASGSDNVGVVGVQFKLGGNNLGAEDTSAPYSISWDTALTSNGTYTLTVTARDAAGNETTSTAVPVTVNNVTADTTPPTVPTNLSAQAISSTQINLSWSTSIDNVGVVGYTVYRNGVQIVMVAGTSISDAGLSPNTTYSYTVSAYDAAGNSSVQSSSVSATIQGIPSNVILPANSRDGEVLKFQNNPTVYLVKPEGLYPFDTFDSFKLYVNSSNQQLKVLNNDASAFTVKPVLARTLLNLPKFKTGTLVNDQGTIYLIRARKKIGFTNFPAFRDLGYSLKDVVLGNTSDLEAVAGYQITTASAPHPWGSWVLYQGTVYYTHPTGLIGVPTWEIFLNNGGSANLILPANPFDLNILRSKPDLPILKENDERVYRD